MFPLDARKPGRLLKMVLTSFSLLAFVGCSHEPPTSQVSGTVTYKGEPVPTGTITFLADDGSGRSDTSSIMDGKYTLPKAPQGPVKIQIIGGSVPTTNLAPPAVRHKMPQGQIKMAEAMGVKPTGTGPPEPAKPKGKPFKLPAKYGQAASSGLTYDVRPGSQTHDIDLSP